MSEPIYETVELGDEEAVPEEIMIHAMEAETFDIEEVYFSIGSEQRGRS